MKLTFSFFLIALLSNCTNVKQSNTIELKKGKLYTHSVKGNPTTGYDWSFTIEPEGNLDVQKTIDYPEGGELIIGSESTYNFFIKGLKKGNAKVTFVYSQPWMPDSTLAKSTVLNFRIF